VGGGYKVKWYSREELTKILRRSGHKATDESALPDSDQWVCEFCLTTIAHRKQTTATEAPYSGYVNELWNQTPAGREKCSSIDNAFTKI
jgi:hypothetical protein